MQVIERVGGQGFWVLFAREKYLPEGNEVPETVGWTPVFTGVTANWDESPGVPVNFPYLLTL